MSSQFTKRFLIGMSFLLITWGIFGVALSLSDYRSIDPIAQDISTSLNSNQAVLDVGFTISTVISSGTMNFSLSSISWSNFGTATFWTPMNIQSLEAGLFALIIGTISLERTRDRRVLKLRDRIVEEVAVNPGIHLRELHRNIGCAMGALQYHLKNLEADDEVVSLRYGNVRHIFPPEYSPDERVLRLTAMSRNPTVGSILSECLKNGQTTQADISRGLDVDKSLISYYTSTLLKEDILRSIKVFGREKPVILTDWARTALTCHDILVQ